MAASRPRHMARDRSRFDVAAARGLTPLVGRSEELGDLAGQLARAERGQSSFTVVRGEPGIGKTRLVSECSAAFRRNGASS